MASRGTSDTDPSDDGPASPTATFLALEFLGAGDVVLPGSVVKELRADGQMNDGVWRQHFIDTIAPPSTQMIQVRGSMIDGVLNPDVNPQSAFLDDFMLTLIPIPEPTSAMLLLIGLGGAVGFARRR